MKTLDERLDDVQAYLEGVEIPTYAKAIAEARAIIARTQKTNDGVPMIPGDIVYVVASDQYASKDEDGYEERVIACKYCDPTDASIVVWPYESVDKNCRWEEFTVHAVYSTREAAEAAKGAK